MPPQEFIPEHRALEGGPSVSGDAVSVVQFLRTVQTEPDSEALGRQKTAPFLIKQRSVGLHPVGKDPARRAVLALQGHDFPEMIEPQDGRLSAMLGKPDRLVGGGLDMLDDVTLQEVSGHAEGSALRIKVFLLQIVTIATLQVAGGPAGLTKT